MVVRHTSLTVIDERSHDNDKVKVAEWKYYEVSMDTPCVDSS